MRIYIDESGGFIPSSAPSRVCCQTALVVPDAFADTLLLEYQHLRRDWSGDREIKGSALTDEQTASALELLAGYDVLVEICGLDVAHHSSSGLRKFQEGQGQAFVNGLTPRHSEASRAWAHTLRDDWLSLSLQLVAQAQVLVLVIEEVIRTAPTYYSQRLPLELGRFDWVIDPKDKTPTRYESVWRRIVLPLLQMNSLARPMVRIREFDYSAFSRYSMATPEYLADLVPPEHSGNGLNLQMLLNESLSFPDSANDLGLQLADITASAFTKAMNGKLPREVWPLLGRLMVEKPKTQPAARLVALGSGEPILVGTHHTKVLLCLRDAAKKMFAN